MAGLLWFDVFFQDTEMLDGNAPLPADANRIIVYKSTFQL